MPSLARLAASNDAIRIQNGPTATGISHGTSKMANTVQRRLQSRQLTMRTNEMGCRARYPIDG
jgi:hypothetical protein